MKVYVVMEDYCDCRIIGVTLDKDVANALAAIEDDGIMQNVRIDEYETDYLNPIKDGKRRWICRGWYSDSKVDAMLCHVSQLSYRDDVYKLKEFFMTEVWAIDAEEAKKVASDRYAEYERRHHD